MEQELIHTKEAFDKAAADFDRQDKANAILQWMRKVTYGIYDKYIPAGSYILELNCGTGIDARRLASRGMRVLATDISDKMLAIARTESSAEIAERKIQFEHCEFAEIGKLNETGFDAAVSNFGGLNCINDFKQLSADLGAKLKPGGKFIAAVINDFCPWEIFYYLLKFDTKNAFRRFNKNGIMAALDDQKVLTFYFSPKRFAKDFENEFSIEKIYAHGLYTPAPYMLGIYKRIGPVVRLWMKIDELVKGWFPFNRFGDHFIIVLKKK